MEELVRRARQTALSGKLTAQDVQGMFAVGTEGQRIIALALMEGAPALADFPSALQAIEKSLSAFEQFHGLFVANLMVSSLSAYERTRLQAVLEDTEVSSRWADDTSRASLAERILSRLQSMP